MPTPTSQFDFNPALSSAWNLCSAVGPEALGWAREIAEWSETVPAAKNILAYTSYLSVLEGCGLHVEVEELLDQISDSPDATPIEDPLGNLINVAGTKHNWNRADRIWEMLVYKFAVEPNHICYVAFAKAHLLAARPVVAVQILDCMTKTGLGHGNGQAAVLYLQALLLTCHASPTKSHQSKVAEFLTASAELDGSDWGHFLSRQWSQLRNASTRFVSCPSSLTLHQILLSDNAKRRNVMMNWPDYTAGSEYLPSQSSELVQER